MFPRNLETILQVFPGIPIEIFERKGNVLGEVVEERIIRKLYGNGNYVEVAIIPKKIRLRRDVIENLYGDPEALFVLYHEKGHINTIAYYEKAYRKYETEYLELLAQMYALSKLEKAGKLEEYLRKEIVYGGEHWMLNIANAYAKKCEAKYLDRLLDLAKMRIITMEDVVVYLTNEAGIFEVPDEDVGRVIEYYKKLGYKVEKVGDIVYLYDTPKTIERYMRVKELLYRITAG